MKLQTLKIDNIVEENKTTRSFYFKHTLVSNPGQFVMLWLPGVGEKPISISGDNGKEFFLTVCGVGKVSNELQKLKTGDKVGIKGPLGTHFNLKGKNIALVGGGYGAGPMAFLAEQAIKTDFKKENVHYVIGARNKDLLLFEDRVKKTGAQIHVATDDGSKGHKGYVTEVLNQLIEENKIDMIYCCGPELMEKAVFDIAVEKNIDCEISIERYIKCGIGVCGSCTVDPLGICMCKQGPVVNKELAKKITEFGVYHRDATGKKIYFK